MGVFSEQARVGRKAAEVGLHTSVVKHFILTPEPIKTRYVKKGLSRAEALHIEKRRITQLMSSSHVLATVQYNERPLPSVDDVVRFIRRRSNQMRDTGKE